MPDLIAIITYFIGGYAAAYYLLRPSALIEAMAIGPGLSPAAWAYYQKHYKLTYPVLAGLLAILALVIWDIQQRGAAG